MYKLYVIIHNILFEHLNYFDSDIWMSAPEVLQKIWFIWQTHALQHGSGGAPTCLWRQRKVPRGEIHPWRLIHWDGFRSSLRIELGSKLGHLWAIHSLSRFSAQWIHRLEISGGIFGCILGQQRSKDFAPDQQLGQPPRCATQRGAAVVCSWGASKTCGTTSPRCGGVPKSSRLDDARCI